MRLRRALIAVLLGIFLILSQWQSAWAHGTFLYGTVSLKGLDFAVRITDPYGGQIQDSQVSVAASLVDQAPASGTRLTEGPPGHYWGGLVVPDAEVFQITLELENAGELYRGVLQVTADEQLTEQRLPLVHIEQAESLPWTTYLYLLVLVVLGIAVGVALRRKRLAVQRKEDE